MTIPDKLVTAAAEAHCEYHHFPRRNPEGPCDDCVGTAQEMLAAAFAKLPECPETRRSSEVSMDALVALAQMAES